MSKYRSAEDAIDYSEQVYVFCREPGCDWHQECGWEDLEHTREVGHVHWQEAHGRG
jgi:hypothetical protein